MWDQDVQDREGITLIIMPESDVGWVFPSTVYPALSVYLTQNATFVQHGLIEQSEFLLSLMVT